MSKQTPEQKKVIRKAIRLLEDGKIEDAIEVLKTYPKSQPPVSTQGEGDGGGEGNGGDDGGGSNPNQPPPPPPGGGNPPPPPNP